MKKLTLVCMLTLLLGTTIIGLFPQKANAVFSRNLLMDDTVFSDSGSMSASQIDAYLNSLSSCISPSSGFAAIDPTGYSPSGGYQYGGNVTAGTVIAHAAQAYDINPQVLLTTLQKEQSLLTSTSCTTNTIAKAVGYACPDSGGSYSYSGVNLYTRSGVTYTSVSGICVNSAAKAGFSQQVIRAAWLLKFSQQRSLGNTNWAIIRGSWDNSDDLQTCYSGAMTQGTFKRCPSDSPTYFDGYTVIDGASVHMDTGATAALYRYTPHFSGNQNFVSIFETRFGSTLSAGYYSCGNSGTNINGAPMGERVIPNRLAGSAPTSLSLVELNNTGSKCIEIHTWTSSMQRWLGHVATNRPSINPDDARVTSGDLNGDGRDELMSVEYQNTGSGRLEVHVWDYTYQKWINHVASNHPAINPADSEVLTADTNGDGRDELFLIKYRNTSSGKVEIHGWTGDMQNWVSHVATNYNALDPSTAQVLTADTNGDGRDEFYLVNYSGTSSGRIEIHGWTSNFQNWVSHVATSHAAVSHADADVIAMDSNGDSRDEFTLVKYHNTGSGRIETHGWNPNLQDWISHNAATP